MSESSFKKTIITSVIWRFLEQASSAACALIIQIILARILLPEEYGVIAIVVVFTTLANVFIQNGFNASLIQSKDVSEVDYSSVFYVSILVAGILYAILYISAPFIAAFYGNDIICPVLRVMGLTLFIGAFNSIQTAIVSRNFKFKTLFICRFGATIVSGVISIVMAYSGFGIWALVAQQLISLAIISALLLFALRWIPKFMFSIKRVKTLFSFGWKVLASSLLDTGYRQITNLIVGMFYSTAELGYYSKGYEFPTMLVTNIDYSIQSVMLPACSKKQDSLTDVKNFLRTALKTSSYLVFPAMFGLAAIAYPMVDILLTEKWHPAVPFIQIFAVSCAFWPITGSITQALNGIGRSDVYLKLKIIGKITGLSILCVTVFISPLAIALGTVFSGMIFIYVLSVATKKIFQYSYGDIWKDLLPSLLLSILMFVVVYSIQYFGLSSLVTLCIQISVGIIFYISLSKALKFESFNFMMNIIKSYIPKK